jgi:hypothetical protein
MRVRSSNRIESARGVGEIDWRDASHLTAGATYKFDRLVVGIKLDVAPDNLGAFSRNVYAATRPRPPPVPVISTTFSSSNPMTSSSIEMRVDALVASAVTVVAISPHASATPAMRLFSVGPLRLDITRGFGITGT